jgi:hypothetical protein
MATSTALSLNENNDETVRVTITTNQPSAGTPLNLTGMTLEAFLKPTSATADTASGVWKGTSAGGDITITDAANGKVAIAIPAAAVTVSQGWWRLDVLSGVLRKTAVYGLLTVTDL